MEVIIDFAVLIIIYFLIFYRKWQLKGKDILLINTTMYIYLSFVLYFTLMSIVTSIPFLLSLSIELLQSLINGFRLSDITDVITNVIGGTIKYLVDFVLY